MRANDLNGMNGSSSGSTFLMGVLCGAAVGAAVGLLLAPKPGAALRQDLMKSAEDFGTKAKKFYDGAAGTVSELASQGAEVADHASQAVGRVAGRIRTSAQSQGAEV